MIAVGFCVFLQNKPTRTRAIAEAAAELPREENEAAINRRMADREKVLLFDGTGEVEVFIDQF